jgi:hypothetical protein
MAELLAQNRWWIERSALDAIMAAEPQPKTSRAERAIHHFALAVPA